MNLTAKFCGILKIDGKEAKEIEDRLKRRREIIEKESVLKTKKIRDQFSRKYLKIDDLKWIII